MPDANIPHPPPIARVRPHQRSLPLRVGTRGSPLALVQTRAFLDTLVRFFPVLRGMDVFQEHVIRTTGDRVQDRSLAEIGGKGLFSKEIHEALLDGRIDFAVHSLKDLETTLPPNTVLACTLQREDARDALVLGPDCAAASAAGPFANLPQNTLIGTNSVRRQAILLHARPDLRIVLLRGNVQLRIDKIRSGDASATVLAMSGLRRLAIADAPWPGITITPLDPDMMVPSAGQGIVGVTVRADDLELRELLAGIENPDARAVSTAERSLLAVLDGSCKTPIGGYAQMVADGQVHLTGLVARPDGSFLLKRSLQGDAGDAARIGAELGRLLRADSPADIFA